MKKVKREEIEAIADLMHLSFTEEELDRMVQETGRFTLYAGKLAEVDTTDLEPTYWSTDKVNHLREGDQPESLETREELFYNVKQEETDYIHVPRIIEDEGAGN